VASLITDKPNFYAINHIIGVASKQASKPPFTLEKNGYLLNFIKDLNPVLVRAQ
jgi:hypothetical protein